MLLLRIALIMTQLGFQELQPRLPAPAAAPAPVPADKPNKGPSKPAANSPITWITSPLGA